MCRKVEHSFVGLKCNFAHVKEVLTICIILTEWSFVIATNPTTSSNNHNFTSVLVTAVVSWKNGNSILPVLLPSIKKKSIQLRQKTIKK